MVQNLLKAGRIRYFGCSNWRVERIIAANEYANKNNLQGFVASQPWCVVGLGKRATSPFSGMNTMDKHDYF